MPAKNAHRLNRIFRKQSNKLSTRDWNENGATSLEANFGVSLSALKKIVDGLTEEDRTRAALGQDPVPLEEQALQKRMQKFGTTTAAAAASAAPSSVDASTEATVGGGVSDDALLRRLARFGASAGTAITAASPTPAGTQELADAIKKRMERFGGPTSSQGPTATASQKSTLTPEDQALLDKRAQRFAS